MGLDIYFYKTTTKGDNFVDVHNSNVKDNRKRYSRSVHRYIKLLEQCRGCSDANGYNETFDRFKRSLNKFYYKGSEAIYKLRPTMSQDELNSWYKTYKPSMKENIYYRKLYFLYDFFNENNENGYYGGWVTKEKIQSLIAECRKHVSNNSFGFVFNGSYYEDTEDMEYLTQIIRDCKHLLRFWKDNERVYVVFDY